MNCIGFLKIFKGLVCLSFILVNIIADIIKFVFFFLCFVIAREFRQQFCGGGFVPAMV